MAVQMSPLNCIFENMGSKNENPFFSPNLKIGLFTKVTTEPSF
jgi:hypothetical protein